MNTAIAQNDPPKTERGFNLVGPRLRALRLAHRPALSQQTVCDQLARRGIEMRVDALCRMESGERPLKDYELLALVDILRPPDPNARQATTNAVTPHSGGIDRKTPTVLIHLPDPARAQHVNRALKRLQIPSIATGGSNEMERLMREHRNSLRLVIAEPTRPDSGTSWSPNSTCPRVHYYYAGANRTLTALVYDAVRLAWSLAQGAVSRTKR